MEDPEAISKPESGELVLTSGPSICNELCKDAIDSLKCVRGTEYPPGFQRRQRPTGLSTRIRTGCQPLVNLLVNLIKYGWDGGSKLFGFYDMDENILVEVTDTGIGIEPQHLPRVFERFYRVDKKQIQGAGRDGPGLAIVKHILKAQAGH